jgi:hypothetical protein
MEEIERIVEREFEQPDAPLPLQDFEKQSFEAAPLRDDKLALAGYDMDAAGPNAGDQRSLWGRINWKP